MSEKAVSPTGLRALTEKEVAEYKQVIRQGGHLKERGVLRLIADWERLRAELDQKEVQLAGVSTAALGGTKDPATPEMWGWSPPYQDTLDLRLKYDALRSLAVEAVGALEAYQDWAASSPAIIGDRYYQQRCEERATAKKKLDGSIMAVLARAAEMGVKP